MVHTAATRASRKNRLRKVFGDFAFKEFQRYSPAQLIVISEVNLAHTTVADFLENFVTERPLYNHAKPVKSYSKGLDRNIEKLSELLFRVAGKFPIGQPHGSNEHLVGPDTSWSFVAGSSARRDVIILLDAVA
jgi:hypothetical protein